MLTELKSGRPDAAQAIHLLREQSLTTLAQQELERRIVSGEIAAGAKLNEEAVASALGISRGPVREAFRALGQAGLVRVEKNRGVFVRQVSLDEASEFYEVRAALEGLIGKLAARRIAINEIEQLRGVVKRMQQVQKSRRAQDYFALNVEFHDLLARAARNNALLANYRSVVKQLDLYRRATISLSAENIPLSTREHEAIVDAVAVRDEARVEALLTQHVLVSRERLYVALGASPPLPSGASPPLPSGASPPLLSSAAPSLQSNAAPTAMSASVAPTKSTKAAKAPRPAPAAKR